MDFHQLLAKMQELDTPATPAVQPEAAVQECGEPMGMPPSMSPSTPPHNPPSLSVNLNAQGMDDIESIMKLMTKVNPDMINQPSNPAPAASMISLPSLGNLDSGPLKMLPDLDSEPEGEPMSIPGADKMNGGDEVSKPEGDLDNDGDHDMDDHDMEKDDEEETDETRYAPGEYGGEHDPDPESEPKGKNPFPFADDEQEDEEEKDEAFANAPTGAPDVQYKDAEYMTKDLAGGMNREKQQFKHSYRAGDNPMSMSESDLRAYIKAELAQRLEEAKTRLSK